MTVSQISGSTGGVVLTAASYANPVTVTGTGHVSNLGGNGIAAATKWTIVNYGSVYGSTDGILLSAGGSITNASGASITGGTHGIELDAAGTVINSGTISAAGGSGFDEAVLMTNGGSITNGAGGKITAPDYAVDVQNHAGTVVNFGSILSGVGGPGNYPMGIYLRAGGSVTNGAGGYIGGYVGVRIDGTASSTVENAGTIKGTKDSVYFKSAGTNLLKIDAGAVFTGKVVANAAGTNRIELTSSATAGTLNGLGSQYLGFQTVKVDAGAQWNFGAVSVSETIQNFGSILTSGQYGIQLEAGGAVTNALGGTMSGFQSAVHADNDICTVVNSGSLSAGVVGVYLAAGGAVTNTKTGAISGGSAGDGARINGGVGVVTNSGAIGGAFSGDGVLLLAGGTVVNRASASITGHSFGGVGIYGGAASVSNAGTISGLKGNGVGLGNGGTVTNAAGGTITGAGGSLNAGVYVKGAAGTVTNSGLIQDTAAYASAIYMRAGGTIDNFGRLTGSTLSAGGFDFGAGIAVSGASSATNEVGGYVKGFDGVVFLNGDATLENAGTIAGSNLAVYFSSPGTNRLIIDPGAVFNGQVSANAGGNNTIELKSASSAGTLNGLGSQYQGFQTITVDAGAKWTIGKAPVAETIVNSGSITGPSNSGLYLAAGGAVTNLAGATINGSSFYGVLVTGAAATIENAGTIIGSADGAVDFDEGGANRLIVDPGAVFNGVVAANLGGNDTIELKSAASAGTLNGLGSAYLGFETVTIDGGAAWTIKGTKSGFGAATVGGLTSNDVLDITDLAFAAGDGATLDSATDVLTITAANGSALTSLNLSGSFAGDNFRVFADGSGTGVVLRTVPVSLISGAYVSGIVLTSGTYANPVTVTGFGNVSVAGATSIGLKAATTWTINNFGNVSAGYGIALNAGGSVFNAGKISGAKAGVRVTVAAGTVENAGTITGGTNSVNFGFAGANRLIIDPGAVFSGVATANAGGTNTIELKSAAGAGTLNGLGSQYVGFQGVTVDSGAHWSIGAASVAETIGNAGSITGAGNGVELDAGGLVSNSAGASISGGAIGVAFKAFGTVVNAGTISGTGGTGFDQGVSMTDGGSITNAAGGTINAGNYAVLVGGSRGTVVNFGRILSGVGGPGNYPIGVYLQAGGTVTNAAGAYVGGYVGVEINGSGATVENAGTIHGVKDSVYFEGAGSNLLKIDGGAVFSGTVTAKAAGTNVIELKSLASAGTLNGLGSQYVGFQTIIVDTGARWSIGAASTAETIVNHGTVTGVNRGIELDAGGTVENAGTISGSSQSVDFSGSGSNRLIVDSGAVFTGIAFANSAGGNTLELTSAAKAGIITGLGSQYVGFHTVTIDAGAAWTIKGTKAGFTGEAIGGFNTKDALDLTDLAFAAGETAKVNAATGVLTISGSGGTTLDTIHLDAAAANLDFVVGTDGHGGTRIVAKPNVAPATSVPASLLAQAGKALAIPKLKVTDSDATSQGETITVVLTDTDGLLSATAKTGATVTGSGTKTLTLSGTLAGINAELVTVKYTGAVGGPLTDSIDVAANDGRGGSNDHTIAVSNNQPVTTKTPASATTISGVAAGIAGLSVADADAVTGDETIKVTLKDSLGKLSATAATGATVTGAGTTLLTLSGTLAGVNAELQSLTYKAILTNGAASAPDTITVTTTDGRGSSNSHSIAVTVNHVPPSVTAPTSLSELSGKTVTLSGFKVSDTDSTNKVASFTVTVSDLSGILSATQKTGGTVAGNGTTSLTLTGSLTAVDAELATLTYTGADTGTKPTLTDTLTTKVTDSQNASASQATTITVGHLLPTTSVPGPMTVKTATVTPVQGVSVADSDPTAGSATFTETIADTLGLLNATAVAGGTVKGHSSTKLVLSGSLTAVNQELATLTYNGTLTGGATSASDTITIATSDGHGEGDQKTIAITITPTGTAVPAGLDQSATLLRQYAAAGLGWGAPQMLGSLTSIVQQAQHLDIAARH
jgi:hypothetical protein